MANYATLKAAIDAVIKTNGNNEITGALLNQVLTAMVDSLGANYQLAGVATPSTNPGTPDQNIFYLAFDAGTYTNFNAIVLPAGISILKWNGSWSSQNFFTVDAAPTASSANLISSGAVFDAMKNDGGAYDVSAHFPTGGEGGGNTYTLETAIAKVPADMQKGGMSIKFVHSSDNKYIQARYTGTEVTGNPNPFLDADNWQIVDEFVPLRYKTLIGANINGKLWNLSVSTGRVYKINTQTPNWATDTIGAESLNKFILRYKLNGESDYVKVKEYTRDAQFKPVVFTPVADANYSVFVRANTGTEVTFSIEDITEAVKEALSAINTLNITDTTSAANKATKMSLSLRGGTDIINTVTIEQASTDKAGLLPAKENWDMEFKANSDNLTSSGVCFKENPIKKIRLKGLGNDGNISPLLVLNTGRTYRVDTPTPNWDVTELTSDTLKKFILRKTDDNGATYTNVVEYLKNDQFKPVEFVAEEGYKYLIFFRATNNVYVDFYVSDIVTQSQLVNIQVGEWNVGKFGFGTNWGIAEDDNYDTILNKTKKVLTEVAADILFVCEYSNYINRSRTINSYNTVLKQFYPYTAINSNDGWCSIFSKYPIINIQETDVTSDSGTRHYIKGEIVINGTTIGIYCIHGNPFSGNDRITEFQNVVASMSQYQYSIIAGDTNVSNNDESSEIQEQELNVFRNAGYTLANVGYWGSKYTEYTGHHALDNIMCKGLNIDSFVVNPDQASSDHFACSSKVSFFQM